MLKRKSEEIICDENQSDDTVKHSVNDFANGE